MTMVVPDTDTPVCDFCSAPSPPHRIGAYDFIMAHFCSPQLGSRGQWAACNTCKELIDGNRWEQLIDRATAVFAKKYAVPRSLRPGLRRTIASTYMRLRENLKNEKEHGRKS